MCRGISMPAPNSWELSPLSFAAVMGNWELDK